MDSKNVIDVHQAVLCISFRQLRATAVFALLLIVSHGQAQSLMKTGAIAPFIQTVDQKSKTFSASFPVEKVYLHFDKSEYLFGETCWYKAYVVDDSQLDLSENSQVLYVDWIGPEDQLISHQQLKLEHGTANSSFSFYTARSGTYTVRAYTQWMRNDDPDFFFVKSISVYDDQSRTPKNVDAERPVDWDVQFFPEGGELLNGVTSKLAFKAIGTDGKGVAASGQVVDDRNQLVSTFTSTHNGMGVFAFTPLKGRSYRAKLNTGKVVDLPKALDSGVAMFANNLGQGNLLVQVQVSHDLLHSEFYLVGQCRGKIYSGKVSMANHTMEIKIPKSDLVRGVMQLTLFDARGIALRERMVFINKHDDLSISVQSDKIIYNAREPVKLTVTVKDNNGLPVSTTLSLAVTDAGLTTRNPDDENILTRLLLQADMRGFIENPGWYFTSIDQKRIFALDLVMMTHGWRKFNWKAILEDSLPSKEFAIEKGLTLHGEVIRKDNNKPLANANLMMIAHGGGYDGVYTTQTDDAGKFAIDNVDFNDSTTQVWKTENEKGKVVDAYVKLMANEWPPLSEIHKSVNDEGVDREKRAQFIRRANTFDVEGLENVKVLEEVEIKGKRESDVPFKQISATAKLWKPSPDELHVNPYQLLTRYEPALAFLRPVRMPDGNMIWPLAFFVDGVQIYPTEIYDPSFNPYIALNSVPTDEIEAVIFSAGMVSIFSKKDGAYRAKTPGRGISKLFHHGYEWPREFYQPKYLPNDTTTSTPDNRLTLLWMPDLKTNEHGEAEVTFYNSDAAKRFQVVIEGLSNGRPGVFIKEFGAEK